MGQILLSIIVPVYGVEKYLPECLGSLLRQNVGGDRYEIVCVDDGSPDGCGEILDAFARENANLTAIRQKNSGVSAARNRGIEAAQGEYLWFVDADDFIVTDCLAEIFAQLERERPDLLLLKPVAFSDGEDTARLHLPDVPADETSEKYALWLWTCVWRKSIVTENRIRFVEGMSFAEDNLFCAMLRPYVKKQAESDRVAYCYRRRPNSLSTTATSEKADALIHSAAVFLRYGEQGLVDPEAAMFMARSLMAPVMAATAALPRREANKRIADLKRQGAYPLPGPSGPAPDRGGEGGNFDDRVLTRLKYVSYTRSGYLRLRAFRVFLKLKRRIKRQVGGKNR